MKAILRILAVTAVVSSTWAGDGSSAEKLDDNGISTTLATFLKRPYFLEDTEINGESIGEISFLKGENAVGRFLSLYFKDEPAPAAVENFGIKIKGKDSVKTFDKIAGIGFNDFYTLDEDEPIIALSVTFESDSSEEMAPVLYAPIFKYPKKFVSDEEGLKEWAETNKLSLAAPFDLQQMNSFEDTNELRMDFGWLESLAKLGVHVVASGHGCPAEAHTRPILISEDTYDKLFAVYLKLRTPPSPSNEDPIYKAMAGFMSFCMPVYALDSESDINSY